MGVYDVVIIGGGHNGLVASAYLARAGARVVVLEQRPWVGGACVTEEPWPGFRINTYAYLAGMLRGEIVRDLELARFGYETIPHDPEVFLPFPNGKSLTFWTNLDKTVREIAKFSAADARAYPKYAEYWSHALDLLEPLLATAPASLGELAQQFPGAEYERLLRDLLLRSAKEFLDEWFESEEVKAVLGFSSTVGALVGPRTPGTAYVLAHNSIAQLNGRKGAWGFAKGGMGRISEAIAAAAGGLGVEIRTSASVRSILIEGGRAVGVALDDGTPVRARAVASAVDVQRTLLKLLPEGTLSEPILREVRRFRMSATTLKFNAALEALPEFRAAPGSPGPHHKACVDIAPSLDYLERAFDQAHGGALADPPFMEILFQSAADPAVAPPGRHTMTCSVKYAPTRLREGNWDDFKPEAAEIVLRTLEQYAPNIRSVIRHYQVVTPADIERTLGMTGGNCFHGELTPDQMFSLRPMPGWAGHRLPVPGLYLVGSSAHPGGGVTGLPGKNGAAVVLADLRAGADQGPPPPG